MFRVKICGITSVEDARFVALAGADAVGLNFYPGSRRFLGDLNVAKTIAAILPSSIIKVGLFVNATNEHILEIARHVQLDAIQLHGDEPFEFIASLPNLPVIKAFRIGSEGLRHVREYLDRCREIGRSPDLVMLDALKEGQYGGTGQTLDWKQLAAEKGLLAEVKIVLAGGLNSSNVAEAIFDFHPDAVDTASGVESEPGKKDHALVQSFVSVLRPLGGGSIP